MTDTPFLIIITGATASGKSALALRMAKQHNGVIINADSMQLYKEAPILTAQPDEQDKQQAPHLLYGLLPAEDSCSAARWAAMAADTIRQVWNEGKQPVIVGGTGLYLHALTKGMADIPDIPPDIRTEIRSMTRETLLAALSAEDPLMALYLRDSDTQRMARALEVIRATGKSLRIWQQQPPVSPLPEAKIQWYMTDMSREELYQRINKRVDGMIQQGALEEARTLYNKNLSPELPLLRAVGVKELLLHCAGTLSLAEAIDAIKTGSRHYAKRQLTWFRHRLADEQVTLIRPEIYTP